MGGLKHYEEATNNGMAVIVKIMIVKIRQMLLYSDLTSTQACLAQTLVTQEQ